jgi:hypothetical protein
MKITPKIPYKISIVETAMLSGRYEICPDIDVDFPNIQEPMRNPNRDSHVPRWNPQLFSYELPDGAAFFCDLLQSGDPQKKWETTEPGDFTKNELVEEFFSDEN